MTKLQMAGCDGGLDLPNRRLYKLASYLQVIASWLNCDPASIWQDIGSSQSKWPLLNLLFVNNPESVKNLCTNRITLNSTRTWRSIRSIEGQAQLSSPLTPILDNSDFLPGCKDQGFKVWGTQGLKKIGGLFKGRILVSFQQLKLQQQFGLFNQVAFDRYL